MFFVAEIGSNWYPCYGSKLIKECKKAGANAVKFQMWRQEDLYPNNREFKRYELTFDRIRKYKEYADDLGIEFFCSVFYPEAVEFLEKLGVKRYKISSRTWLQKDPHAEETIKAVGDTEKEIISSSRYRVFPNERILYCIPKYPANPEEIDWDTILEYDGFSDHTLGIESALKYARLKPDGILEKHVKLEDSKGPDVFFSITTQELAQLITLSKSESVKLG